jgi:HPt (histidine-containing phosphotransfer) domain-containing protein
MGDAGDGFAQAMNRLWAKHLPQMQDRVATLKKAAESLANGSLSGTEQHQAGADAHKLAGVLGTFGLTQGTELAREAETLCGASLHENPRAASRLAEIAERLHVMIASRS